MCKALGRLQALRPNSHPVSVRAKVEVDYLHKLNDAELAWLATFTDQWAGADYRDDPWDTSPAKRREAYRDKNRANRDLLTWTQHGGRLVDGDSPAMRNAPAPVDQDLAPTPAYQSTPQYAQALTAYRQAIDNPQTTDLELAQARVALEVSKQ